MKTIGERITEHRIALGWTQEQLSQEVGIGRPAISKIEAGKRNVSATEIVKFAKMLRCKPSDLLDDTVELKQSIEMPEPSVMPEPSRCPHCGSRLFKAYGCVYNVATDQGDQTGWHCLHCCHTFETYRLGKTVRHRITGQKPVTLQPGELAELRAESSKRTIGVKS